MDIKQALGTIKSYHEFSKTKIPEIERRSLRLLNGTPSTVDIQESQEYLKNKKKEISSMDNSCHSQLKLLVSLEHNTNSFLENIDVLLEYVTKGVIENETALKGFGYEPLKLEASIEKENTCIEETQELKIPKSTPKKNMPEVSNDKENVKPGECSTASSPKTPQLDIKALQENTLLSPEYPKILEQNNNETKQSEKPVLNNKIKAGTVTENIAMPLKTSLLGSLNLETEVLMTPKTPSPFNMKKVLGVKRFFNTPKLLSASSDKNEDKDQPEINNKHLKSKMNMPQRSIGTPDSPEFKLHTRRSFLHQPCMVDDSEPTFNLLAITKPKHLNTPESPEITITATKGFKKLQQVDNFIDSPVFPDCLPEQKLIIPVVTEKEYGELSSYLTKSLSLTKLNENITTLYNAVMKLPDGLNSNIDSKFMNETFGLCYFQLMYVLKDCGLFKEVAKNCYQLVKK